MRWPAFTRIIRQPWQTLWVPELDFSTRSIRVQRKVLILHICFTNSNPSVIAKQYLQFLIEHKKLPVHMRMDRGTESGKMATLHAHLISKVGKLGDPTDAIIYGPSKTNKIGRWWRDLKERLEMLFKIQVEGLLSRKENNPQNKSHRQLFAYVVQRECDVFVNIWNTHRIWKQKNILLLTGIPNHIFEFPQNYSGVAKGFPLAIGELEDAALAGDLLSDDTDFLTPEEKEKCESIRPNPDKIACAEAAKFTFLKSNLGNSLWPFIKVNICLLSSGHVHVWSVRVGIPTSHPILEKVVLFLPSFVNSVFIIPWRVEGLRLSLRDGNWRLCLMGTLQYNIKSAPISLRSGKCCLTWCGNGWSGD